MPGQPAARMTDVTQHGGEIVTGSEDVIIGGKPAARVGDLHTCPMVEPGPAPHVGGPILRTGSTTVFINFQPAARVMDLCECTGPADAIAAGEFSVLIG
jgi:uncharacterized Zn-binding protein involved in type VI secretion